MRKIKERYPYGEYVGVNKEKPVKISIYPTTFENKDYMNFRRTYLIHLSVDEMEFR